MVPELEKARVTELHVRMDCNGCVQRIKKAIISIDGVYSIYVDFAQQKLTVVGNADPERLVRAIKKTRKTATIYSHTEPEAPAADAPPASDPPPSEAPAEAAAPPADSELPKDAPPPEEPAPEPKPDTTEVHMVHHYPHNYVYREHWSHDYPPSGHGMRYTAAPYYVTPSYNIYRPSASVSGYGNLRFPPRDVHYSGEEAYTDGYYHGRGGRNGNQITSMFSDENPNACRIV